MSFQLSSEEIKSLRDAQPAIRDLEHLISLLEEAGLDMTPQKEELARRKQLVYGFLRVFNPSARRSSNT